MAHATPPNASTRRTFLATSAATAALGVLAAPRGVHADGDSAETLKLGLIGCGGRGEGAVIDALRADPHVELTAVGDTFADRAQECLARLQKHGEVGSRIKVTPDNCFPSKDPDFDNYKHVIDSGVDVVILATPPHFRPQHLAYAVEKGKHCFVEKPVGVDVPGVKSVQETCAKAKEKGLAIVSGLVWRADPGVIETIDRIRDGAIGDIVAVQSCYNAGTLWHRDPQEGQTPWSRMEYQVRNWLYYTWLSGDHINEQAIHSLDKVNWLLGDVSPVEAVGMGGRQQRVDPKWGHIYDHHTVFYDYPSGVKAFFTCRQQDNTSNFVDEIVLGTKGRAQVLAKRIDGPSKWRYRGGSADAYMLEHVNLFNGIRSGDPLNQGHYMCNSTLVAIMGRMCTYTGQKWSWDQLMASEERLGPGAYEWGDVPEPPVAIPGITKLA
jgi:predicted dehydrogenase